MHPLVKKLVDADFQPNLTALLDTLLLEGVDGALRTYEDKDRAWLWGSSRRILARMAAVGLDRTFIDDVERALYQVFSVRDGGPGVPMRLGHLPCRLVGFEELNLHDYEVCAALTPFVRPAMVAIEAQDLLVDRIVLSQWTLGRPGVIRVYPQALPDGSYPMDFVHKGLPAGLVGHLLDLSSRPTVVFPQPVPPPDVAAVLDRLDVLLFSEGAEKGCVLMNPRLYQALRKWRSVRIEECFGRSTLKMGYVADLMRPEFDPETATQDEFLVHRRTIWLHKDLPSDCVYVDDMREKLTGADVETSNDVALDWRRIEFLGHVWPSATLMLRDILKWRDANPGRSWCLEDDADRRLFGFGMSEYGAMPMKDGSGIERVWHIRAADVASTLKALPWALEERIKGTNLATADGRRTFMEMLNGRPGYPRLKTGVVGGAR